jgi:hypothetical protein
MSKRGTPQRAVARRRVNAVIDQMIWKALRVSPSLIVRVGDKASDPEAMVQDLLACRTCGRPLLLIRARTSSVPSKPECRKDDCGSVAQARRLRTVNCPRPDKVAWGTVEAARQMLRFIQLRQTPNSGMLRVYRCRCGSFHIGNYRPRGSMKS